MLHGWVYLHVIVDCCTREICGWTLDVRTRATEAICCVEAAFIDRQVRPGVLTLGTNNGRSSPRETSAGTSPLVE
ncbi:DDE-type integrase/transposase/recombinase [Rhabdothermincola sediminis]|uniref:DDE-type integrase/transposase/recombinase n=1 Tax=Rhabdothermincola sediminis TaxID=2751370 RepID=UPI001AA02673|nr:DDE-type integrase/transposase/recombinase [Rhabdothermincola sediminis]